MMKLRIENQPLRCHGPPAQIRTSKQEGDGKNRDEREFRIQV
jgi:hypothetical protein